MTQEELNSKIEELEKQIAELKQVKVEGQKRWKPENEERYFYADYDCVENTLFFDYDKFDNWTYLLGNCFKTEQEAEEYKTKLEIRAKCKNYIEEHSESLDWKNEEQKKWYIYYVSKSDEFYYTSDYIARDLFKVYASSEQILRDAIDYIGGEEVAKKYLFD